ncbi:MAG: hypothetical protein AAGA87_05930 [Pseudomonadota bacterium]
MGSELHQRALTGCGESEDADHIEIAQLIEGTDMLEEFGLAEAISLLCILLALGSFAVFARLALRKPKVEPKKEPPAGQPPTEAQALSAKVPTPKDIGELAEQLSKAGPTSTAASLAVFFVLVALIASGTVEVSVSNDKAEEKTETGES